MLQMFSRHSQQFLRNVLKEICKDKYKQEMKTYII